MRLEIIFIWVAIFISCNSEKRVAGKAPFDYVPTMTNRQLTDAYVRTSDSLLDVIEKQDSIIASMLIPDPTIFEMRNGILVFKSRVAFDSVNVRRWLWVGEIIDTSFHVELPLDSIKVKQ